ncbi:NAD(P)-binding protein [Mycena kentingensis (nom. inval.)]|nr:NAD(P)-binding protein [Mycena kentingensis (nom. inval.)]
MSTPASRVAVVTGAAQGIGRAIALRLADDGFDLVVNDLESKHRTSTRSLKRLEAKGRLTQNVVDNHRAVDVFVANAGTSMGRFNVSVEEFDRLTGEQMVKHGGRIIGASSIATKKGMVTQVAYSASKAAIRALTQCAAQEFGAAGITVNAYAPGAIDTPMLTSGADETRANAIKAHFIGLSPLNTIGEPQDVASLVSFLASKESGFITGQSISINGGIFFD